MRLWSFLCILGFLMLLGGLFWFCRTGYLAGMESNPWPVRVTLMGAALFVLTIGDAPRPYRE